MSIELPAFDTRNEVVDDSDSSDEIASEVDEDQTWDDWTEQDRLPCKSLFEDKVFEDVEKAVAHDKEKWGFDLGKTSKDLSWYT
jgi:protein arginine N-methyltransferase 3